MNTYSIKISMQAGSMIIGDLYRNNTCIGLVKSLQDKIEVTLVAKLKQNEIEPLTTFVQGLQDVPVIISHK